MMSTPAFYQIGMCLLAAAVPALAQGSDHLRWFKGNTHTHTWWSDGDSPPEVVVAWYKEHGYHFLVLSDHNVLSEGEKWVAIREGPRLEAARLYEERFGLDWVQKRTRTVKDQQVTEYRLKTLAEFRSRYEQPGKFLMIQGEEISDSFDKKPVHVNGINLREYIPPPGGASMLETMQNNMDAVHAQSRRLGVPMFPHLNHPNFHWANPVEDIMRLRGATMVEVHNGHPSVNNYGDAQRPSAERIWDIALTRRLTDLNLPIMYGLATDDAHNYLTWEPQKANPGRGWVMVRARELAPDVITEAMQRGDFYASTGVVLEDVRFENDTLEIRIQPREGVTYKTQFIGTLKSYRDLTPPATQPRDHLNREVGKVLAEADGLQARYKLTGREIYVRAKVVSTARKQNPYKEGDVEVAWTQPVQSGAAPSARR